MPMHETQPERKMPVQKTPKPTITMYFLLRKSLAKPESGAQMPYVSVKIVPTIPILTESTPNVP